VKTGGMRRHREEVGRKSSQSVMENTQNTREEEKTTLTTPYLAYLCVYVCVYFERVPASAFWNVARAALQTLSYAPVATAKVTAAQRKKSESSFMLSKRNRVFSFREQSRTSASLLCFWLFFSFFSNDISTLMRPFFFVCTRTHRYTKTCIHRYIHPCIYMPAFCLQTLQQRNVLPLALIDDSL
jgi:hypothetical protein